MKKNFLLVLFLFTYGVVSYSMESWVMPFVIYDNYIDADIYPKKLSIKDPIAINEQDEWGDTLLHKAVEGNKNDEISSLLWRGARCDINNQLGQTPVSLLFSLPKREQHDLQLLFERYGCFFVQHDQNNYSKNIPYLLQDGAKVFNGLLETLNNTPHVVDMMISLQRLLNIASDNEGGYRHKGSITAVQDASCFIYVTLSDLNELYGEDVIRGVGAIVKAYLEANEFILLCESDLYIDAAILLEQNPLFKNDVRMCRYILSRLLNNHTEKCWSFILKQGFSPNISHSLFGTILHYAACVYNAQALYFLISYGADLNATDRYLKKPVEHLLENIKSKKYKEQAIECLAVVSRAIKKRMVFLQNHDTGSEEIGSLLDMEDYIRRATHNKVKNAEDLFY